MFILTHSHLNKTVKASQYFILEQIILLWGCLIPGAVRSSYSLSIQDNLLLLFYSFFFTSRDRKINLYTENTILKSCLHCKLVICCSLRPKNSVWKRVTNFETIWVLIRQYCLSLMCDCLPALILKNCCWPY